jgi:dUTP pyrophosphatase
MSEVNVKFRKLHPDAAVPTYGTEKASGIDLYALEVVPRPYGADVKTGIAIELPEGYEAQVRPRSGLSRKGWMAVFGTIDEDYRGDIGITLYNVSDKHDVHFPKAGERVAQLVIVPVVRANLVEVEELSDTQRGTGGFGSTGMK